MALIGTISGSNGTSNTAVAGTLVVANETSASFPAIPADATLFVSGAIGGRGAAGGGVAVVGGDMVVSGNAYFTNADVSDTLTYLSGVVGEQRVTGNLIMSGTGVITSIGDLSLTGYEVGSIYIDPSSSIYLSDVWTSESVSWPDPLGVRLSSTGSEWDGYYTIFGNKSLIGAISASAAPTPPGGSNTQVQFNDSGVFSGSSLFTFNKTSGAVTASYFIGNGGSLTNLTASTLIVSGVATINDYLVLSGNQISGSAGGNITLGTGGNITVAGDLAVNGDDITTNQTTFNLINATATTVNIAGAASSALNVGNVAGTNTLLGQTKFSQGLSGSLTKLTDGTSYLIAGTNVTITTGSSGAVTIASTGGGGGDSFFTSTTAGAIFTTGSLAVRGGESAIDSPSDKGADVFFYVSGSVADGLNRALFGGQVVASGSIKALAGLSGSLTKLTDGTSYLIAGTGTEITTGSSGAVTVGVSPSYITSLIWIVG